MSAFYFVSLILIGQYTILNLFIAILLANFEAQHGDETQDEEQMFTSSSKKTFHRTVVSARQRVTTVVDRIKSSVFGVTRVSLTSARRRRRNKVLDDDRFHSFVENAKLLEDLQNLERSTDLDDRNGACEEDHRDQEQSPFPRRAGPHSATGTPSHSPTTATRTRRC